MDIDASANFLVGAVLMDLGFCVLAIALVFINNIFSKYWKPIQVFKFNLPPTPRFATEEEMQQLTPRNESINSKKD